MPGKEDTFAMRDCAEGLGLGLRVLSFENSHTPNPIRRRSSFLGGCDFELWFVTAMGILRLLVGVLLVAQVVGKTVTGRAQLEAGDFDVGPEHEVTKFSFVVGDSRVQASFQRRASAAASVQLSLARVAEEAMLSSCT